MTTMRYRSNMVKFILCLALMGAGLGASFIIDACGILEKYGPGSVQAIRSLGSIACLVGSIWMLVLTLRSNGGNKH